MQSLMHDFEEATVQYFQWGLQNSFKESEERV